MQSGSDAELRPLVAIRMKQRYVMRLFCVLFCMLLCALLLACAPRAKFDVVTQPGWVSGVSQQYSTSHYFVGSGRAAALDVAAKNARAVLADTLPVILSAVSSSWLTDFVQNAEVVDAWFDKNTREHYALVVLERTAVVNQLRQQLMDLDEATKQFISTATQETDLLLQIQATHKALATQPQRTDLLSTLQVLGIDASADDAVWTVIELQAHLQSLLGSIDVRPRTGQDRQLNSAVARGLDAAGYLSNRMMPSFELKTSLERSGMKWEQGWFTEHGTLVVELLDQQNQVRARAQWPLKAQTRERALLDKALMESVKGTLETEFGSAVMGFITEIKGSAES